MADFYNPYHFVPVEKPKRTPAHPVTRENFVSGKPEHATHARYMPETLSGRLVVRLETVTPVVVGSDQSRPNPKDYATVTPYMAGGVPAIPASSLRGLIGSVIEAASGGPLRVLDDRAYSYRRRMDQALSAIGLIVKGEKDDELALKPMCLPMLESNDGGRSFGLETLDS